MTIASLLWLGVAVAVTLFVLPRLTKQNFRFVLLLIIAWVVKATAAELTHSEATLTIFAYVDFVIASVAGLHCAVYPARATILLFATSLLQMAVYIILLINVTNDGPVWLQYAGVVLLCGLHIGQLVSVVGRKSNDTRKASM